MTSLLKKLTTAKVIASTFACIAVTLVCLLFLWNYWNNSRKVNPAPDDEEVEVPAEDDLSVTPEYIKRASGWAGPDIAKQEFERLKGSFTNFLISDAATKQAATSEDKRSCLHEAARKILGQDIPTFRQLTGDCVSMGMANAVMYLQVADIAAGAGIRWKPVFPPFLYGVSRLYVGKGRIPCRSSYTAENFRDAGSVGSWAAAGVQEYGVLFSDATGCPPYGMALANKWGCEKAAFEKFMPIARLTIVKSAAQVTTWQQVRDSLVNGYPVTIASDVGFESPAKVVGGKMFLAARGSWGHQMCVIGYDPKPEPCFLIINSWGEKAHGKQTDGPQGSFWVVAKAIQRIVAQQDSFAISGLEGFPKREWDLDILQHQGGNRDAGILPAHLHDRVVRPNVGSELSLSF